MPPPRRTDGVAVAAMVLGVASMVLWLWATVVVPAAAILLGAAGLARVGRASDWPYGRGMAVAGIVLGAFGTACGAALWTAVASGLGVRWWTA